MMSQGEIPDYSVVAANTGHGSDNKIHDDSVARRFGFTGALVPGVDVYAYMVHAPLFRWGYDWLEHGYMHVRLVKPVYDGDETIVRGVLNEDEKLSVSAATSEGLCGEGLASLNAPCEPSNKVIRNADLPALGERPPADQSSLNIGATLGARYDPPSVSVHAEYLVSIHEKLSIFEEKQAVHPGYLLRRANLVLRENVLLGPWIHVESWIWNLRSLSVEESITTRALVTDNFERKGHRFVDLDISILAQDTYPICRIKHRSIYLPRQMRADIPQ